MLVIGHRGSPLRAPENSLEGIEQAIAEGADLVEVDVRLSLDKVLMVIHDPSLRRTFDNEGMVAEMTASELEAAGVPTLERAFASALGRLVIEVKLEWGSTLAQDSVRQLREFLPRCDHASTIVSSFDLAALEALRGEVALGALTHPALDVSSAIATGVSYDFLFLPAEQADADAIQRAHDLGVKVIPWTVNDQEQMHMLKASEVEGLITDDPERAVRVLRQ